MRLRRLKVFDVKHNATYLNNLPYDLLDEIIANLSRIDQVCLALTCKGLWIYFQSFLRAQKLELSQFFQCQSRTRYDNTFYSTPTTELLHRLQNRRWNFCRMCWKLHRYSSWGDSRISESKVLFPYRPNCMPFTGTINTCPCLKVNYELDFIRTVRYVEVPNGLSMRANRTWTSYIPERWEGPRHLSQARAFDGYCYSPLDVFTALYWESGNNILLVDSTYFFQEEGFLKKLLRDEERSARRLLAERGMKEPVLYDYDNTQGWLQQLFHEAGHTSLNLNETNWTWTSPALCRECHNCNNRKSKKWSFKTMNKNVQRDTKHAGETGKSLASKFWSNFRKLQGST